MAPDTRTQSGDGLSAFGRANGDLLLVVVAVAATAVAVLADAPAVLRAPLAVLFVFFVPGYTLTAALFPSTDTQFPSLGPTASDGITTLDRYVFSVGLSIATVILVGVGINAMSWALSTGSLLVGLATVTGVTLPAASLRRQETPVGKRYSPYPEDGLDLGSRLSAELDVVGVVLVVCLLFAGGAVAVSTGMDDDQSSVTELYFVSGDTGAEYQTNYTVGDSTAVPVAIGNHEGEARNYTLIGQLQRAERTNGTTTVQERQEIHRSETFVESGATETVETTVTPMESGQYRLTFLLYLGEPPAEPTADSAYREVHLWIVADRPTLGA